MTRFFLLAGLCLSFAAGLASLPASIAGPAAASGIGGDYAAAR